MLKKSWKIRKATIDDAIGLKECMVLAYSIYLDRLSGQRLPPMDVDYVQEIKNFPVWVAVSDNTIVGGLILVPEEETLSIANIAVRPDFQGNGLGRGFMEFAESEATARGYSELRLATHVLLTENVECYIKLGWTEFDRDETRVYMKKNLR